EGVVGAAGAGRRSQERDMSYKKIPVEHIKKIGLVAHDNKKRDLLEWARYNKQTLAKHKLYATGTTGKILEQELGLSVTKLQSGPLGHHQEVGARLANSDID